MKRRFAFILLLAVTVATSNVSAQRQAITLYVSAARGNDENAGTSPARALKSLRYALNMTWADGIDDDVTIKVEKGTYYPYDVNGDLSSPDLKGQTFLMFRHPDYQAGRSLRVLGGYDFTTGTRDMANNLTILDGGRRTASGGVDHVITMGLVDESADSLVIEGFTVQGAAQRGVYSATVIPDRLYTSSTIGGGITIDYCTSNKVAIRNCVFTDNEKTNGGAVNLRGSSGVTFTNCVFSNNIAGWSGPNTGEGGALYCAYSQPNFLNCIFYGNNANIEDAAMFIFNTESQQTVKIGNCTFTGNSSSDYNLITSKFVGRVQVTNSILWGNDADRLNLPGTEAAPNDPSSGDVFLAYNSTEFSTGIETNYRTSPDFRDIGNPKGADGKWFTADDGLQIKPCSTTPALDSGNNNYGAGSLSADILGRPRIYNGTIDLGPYEDQTPLKNYFRDNDNDGFGNGSATFKFRCLRPGYSEQGRDCDDNDSTVNPGAQEICDDGKDNNCNGVVDGDAILMLNLEDKDGDGYGDPNSPALLYCEVLPGHSNVGGDCDDNDATVNPSAFEICDGKDNDCNGAVDESSANYYLDSDGDGYGKNSDVITSCTPVEGRVTASGDCNDNDATVNPGTIWVLDNDKDGYYSGSTVTQCASPGTGYAVKTIQQAGDCNDNDNTVYPGAPDICDGKDNDCNGGSDDDFRYQKKYYRDSDGDGFGYSQDFVLNCSPVSGRVAIDGDCDDNNAAVNPGATEVCGNNKDDNCNGLTDEGCSTTAVTSFVLVNATSDKDIKTLTNGSVIDLATIIGKAINIRANTSPAKVGSVKFVLTGKQSKTQTDNALPYALFSDNSGNYNSWQPDPGSYTLTATPYASSNGTGVAGAPLTLSFTVVDNTPKISGFVLVNATTDKDIKTLTNGTVIDLAITPSINIRANAVGNTGSVRFALNSTVNYKTENTAPFTIAGNNGGDYSNWNIAPGTYTLKATPYSADNAGGTAGISNTITITVKRSRSARPAITTTEAGSESNMVAENKSGRLSLYPNPTSGYITIRLQAEAVDGTVRIELLDLPGRILLAETGTLVKGTLRKQMQLPATAAAGVYLLRVVAAGKVYQAKLVYAR